MLRTIEKYFGAISSMLFSVLVVLILEIDPKTAHDAISWLQSCSRPIQTGILFLAIITLWSGIKEFTG